MKDMWHFETKLRPVKKNKNNMVYLVNITTAKAESFTVCAFAVILHNSPTSSEANINRATWIFQSTSLFCCHLTGRASSCHSISIAITSLLKLIPVALLFFFLWECFGKSKHSNTQDRMWCLSNDIRGLNLWGISQFFFPFLILVSKLILDWMN